MDDVDDPGRVVYTSAGLCAVWQPEAFAHVVDLDTWEDHVAEDEALIRQIAAGAFVPINIGGDGAFQVVIRQTPLTERERRYLLVSSEPYLLISKGSVNLGGLENVGEYVGDGEELELPAGRYSVYVHLIDWKLEPGSFADGEPTASALPDFVVEVAPETDADQVYRGQVRTFN
ncbi:DUF6386 family protein [Actinokineospora xionganensis]|uniref:Restriction endonuclease domain-containing protein n=1 Tax=Actinokineospora xionganensis TaxID=2684470 RepID=A0ABR7LH59_9PSEU|nr:hypothetical protein [Actinokineospora xionganensis]MBC6451699.1 hypothetical protein [Actinokineospora xionganensis]